MLAQWDALRAISRTPGASAREPAAATFQTEQAFGTLVVRLTAQGLVDRRPGRGRRIEHHLTGAGERVLAAGARGGGPGVGGMLLLKLLQRLNELAV